MRLSIRALLLLAVSLAGCGEEGSGEESREWRASDHQQPVAPEPETPGSRAPDPEAPTEEVIARAVAALYLARCASCHGVEGRGDGEAAPVSEMPNFTTTEYQDGRDDADIARAIRMGDGLMPAFGQQLNERGIAALVAHVRHLRGGG